ncbi:hypothetical protein ACFLT9_09740 [Acidobacteriota bacterium]
MKITYWANTKLWFSLIIFLFVVSSMPGQTEMSEEVLTKNIKAAGDVNKLSGINNFSFKTDQRTYYMSKSGQMKITAGTPPIITQTILINGDEITRNCYNDITEIIPLMASTYKVQALLRSGFFTLINFKDNLSYGGLKKFGIKKLHKFSTEIGKLQVEFYLDSETYTIQRMVLKGFHPVTGTYEINNDFGEYRDFDGIRLPVTWFASQVGTRGANYALSDVKYDLPLEEAFFTNADVNVGDVKIQVGRLDGAITSYSFRRNTLTLQTNWTEKCIHGAGFLNMDRLRLNLKGNIFEIDYYAGQVPQNASRPGGGMLVRSRRDENYVIYLFSKELGPIAEQLEALLPISIEIK